MSGPEAAAGGPAEPERAQAAPVAAGTPTIEPAWAPLRNPVYRVLWSAQLVSAIGTWMQTVGAQWLLVGEPNAATLVALVQTASMLPVLLLALPAGVLADAFDRRRLLIGVQTFMLIVGLVLAALTAMDEMTPALLLSFTFLLGCGATLTLPAWQALIPELVPRNQLPTASALGGISMNAARAIGPAVAGLLIARIGVEAVFLLNAATFAVMIVALATWRRPAPEPPELPERFGPALRAGSRYVRHSLVVRRILLRSSLFVLPGSVLWALLPLVATQRLKLGADGYGLLLAALGVGAVSGALVLPRVRARLSTNRMVFVASLVYALALAVVGLVPVTLLVAAVLLAAGASWLAILTSLNATMQMFLPGWVRARALSTYLVVFMGGQGLGALAWGLLSERSGLEAAFVAAAVLMAAGAASLKWWPLRRTEGMDRSPAEYWPEPHLAIEPELEEGPVLITATYRVRPERAAGFLDAMNTVRRSRQRTGAYRWGLFRDGAEPDLFVEAYLVPSWAEHLHQHSGRLTGSDRASEERAIAFAESRPHVAHLFPARPED